MARSEGIPLGRLGGTPVVLRPSWFLVAAVVALLYAPTVEAAGTPLTARALAIGGLFAVVLLLSVLVHEVAHTVAARLAGTPPHQVVLDVWGGHTAFDADVTTPRASFAIAVVGPASNAVLAVLAWSVASRLDGGATEQLVRATAVANLLVAALNALPGLPLDGGRVLEALVWQLTGERTRGTLLAGWCGRAVAVAVGAAGFVPAVLRGERPSTVVMIWLLLVAALLWQGATQSLRLARWQRLAPLVTARALLRPAVGVPSTATVAAVGGPESRRGAVVVLDLYGRPAAVLDERAAAAVPPQRTAEVLASAVAHALARESVVPDHLSGLELLERLQAHPAQRYVVTDGDGRVVGVLDWDDVAAAVGAR